MAVRWTTAVLTVPADRLGATVDFWAAVTVTEPRRTAGGAVLLEPRDGTGYLQVRPVTDGPAGVHLLLHAVDAEQLGMATLRAGAQRVDALSFRSPGGLLMEVVPAEPTSRAPVRRWPDGRRSMFDQVCIDAPPTAFEQELAFWRTVTGFDEHSEGPPFTHLDPPGDQSVQLLVQRLDEGAGPVRAHLDLGTSAGGREAEVARHRSLGAIEGERFDEWTVLRDPAGLAYCVTDHPPR